MIYVADWINTCKLTKYISIFMGADIVIFSFPQHPSKSYLYFTFNVLQTIWVNLTPMVCLNCVLASCSQIRPTCPKPVSESLSEKV